MNKFGKVRVLFLITLVLISGVMSTLLVAEISPATAPSGALNNHVTREASTYTQAIESPQLSCEPLKTHLTTDSELVLSVVNYDSQICTLADGFSWTEGPLWVDELNSLLFSDIPAGKVYRYSPASGLSTYLAQSGYSNGLLLSPERELVLLQSRSRKVASMAAPLMRPKGAFITLVNTFNGQQLNSPNDGVFDGLGGLYFTDPPYGLPNGIQDENKVLNFQGVFYLSSSGDLSIVDDTLSYPNGVALTPNGTHLIVSVSDPTHQAWYRYTIPSQGELGPHGGEAEKFSQDARSLFYKIESETTDAPLPSHGLPDGMAFHDNGLLFASGPEGVWIFNQKGEKLGHIYVNNIVANLAFDSQMKTLYLTANQTLMKITLADR